MQILEDEFTDKPTCGNTTVTHIETDIDQTDLYMCTHVWPDTHRLNMHQQTATHRYVPQYAHICVYPHTETPSSTQT